MVQMKYPVFVQALALTIVVLLVGMYIGIVMEQGRAEEINNYYVDSEVMLIDVMSLNNLVLSGDAECSSLRNANENLLNRVYEESVILEDYESSGRLTEILKPIHQKYDVLRTYLWMNAIQIKDKCEEEFNTIVYLYNYSEEDINKKAEQNVWSKVLYEIKQEHDSEVLLIPIAVDTNLETLNALISEYEIETLPAVIVNEENVFRELSTKDEVLDSLN